MTTLHDRLAELADDAPPGGPDANLWDRGRHLHRRRQVGTAVIVAVVVLTVGALGAADWMRSRPAPRPADSAPALPDRIWAPSPWLPGTGETGPLGQLAAVQFAERGSWTGTDRGLVGISATAGEYRFLDLPDATEDEVALSPDGGHVAYWYTGEARESPNSDTGPVVGVAVYDTTSGEVLRHPVPTDHGLAADSLAWADPDRLVFSHLQYLGGDTDSEMAQHTANDDSGLRIWVPETGAEDDSLLALGDGFTVESSTGRGQLLLNGPDGPAFVDLDHPADAVSFVMPMKLASGSAAVDDTGSRVAWPYGTSNPNRIVVGLVRDGERVNFEDVPRSGHTFHVWAWLDEERVAAVRRVGSDFVDASLFAIDVRTGDSAELVRFPPGTYGSQTQLATDLLDEPTVFRDAPPRPLDPRVMTGMLVAVVAGGLGVLVLWRRRVRP